MYLNTYSTEPARYEVIMVGDIANIYVREDIKPVTVQTEDGEQTQYTCKEYFAKKRVGARGFEVTEDFITAMKAQDYAETAKEIRAKRDALLAESDKEVLPDRLNKNSNLFKAWSEYREALRDIPEQEGFPYEVEFPNKPNEV